MKRLWNFSVVHNYLKTSIRLMKESRQHQNKFIYVHRNEESGHIIAITKLGIAYSWSYRRKGPLNEFGQLGRGSTMGISKELLSTPAPVVLHNVSVHEKYPKQTNDVVFVRAYTGGTKESGHSALLDSTRRRLYICGCDRWQQLGLGSHHAGALGYTWKGGKLWQTEFHRNEFLDTILHNEHQTIRDVALGGDHTVVLTEEKRDVYTFGRGGDGQLGGVGKPFVSAPMRSKRLSGNQVAAVCAVKDCTVTLNSGGDVLEMVGHCRAKDIQKGIYSCIEQSKSDGLILKEE